MPKEKHMDVDSLIKPIAELPKSNKGKEPNPIYDDILKAMLTRPNGNYQIDTTKLTMQPKTLYVTLRRRIKADKKLSPLSLSFRSNGALYIIVDKK